MYLSKELWTGIILKRLKKKVNQYRRVFYSTLSILFFLGNYHLCQYFYPLNDDESIRLWWLLKVDVYCLVIALCYLSISAKGATDKGIIKIEMFMYSFGVGLAVSNFIDRRLLGHRNFEWDSYYAVAIIAVVSYFNVKRLTKQAEQHAKNLTNERRRKK